MARYCSGAFAFAAVVLAAGTHVPNRAAAQNPNDFMRMFGGIVQQAMRQAAMAEWQRLPPAEFACLDQSLRQQGASAEALAARGVAPSDQRLLQNCSACRTSQTSFPVDIQNLSSKATIDCTKAKRLTALTVCLDQAGAAADWDLISAFWARYFSIDQSERQAFEQAQDAWIDGLNHTCPKNPNPS